MHSEPTRHEISGRWSSPAADPDLKAAPLAPIFGGVPSIPETDRVEAIRRRLLEHFDREKRDLPWRGETDPYRVWVSEVMLQQTRVETVVPYYREWLERFPDVAALARADRSEVLRAWEGLGYYSRARNLHDAAGIVADRLGGAVPDTAEELRELPGVGEYTAGAVASIAFDRREPAVDGNARRVLSRLFDVERPTPARLRRIAADLVPDSRPGDFNQAVMELGATVCSPASPVCATCPVEPVCLARDRGTVEERPRPRRRGAVPAYEIGVAVVVSADRRTLLVRRPEDGMLGGLWEFPGRVATEDIDPHATAVRVTAALLDDGPDATRRIDRVEQIYSHRHHTYHAWLFHSDREPADVPLAARREGWTDAAWIDAGDLDGIAVSTAQRKIAGAVAPLLDPAVPC